jgi:nitrite reductase/ring-hydroxylating ferredoxin subunit
VEIGSAKEFTFGHGRSAFSMFVVRTGDAKAVGYLNLCPHFSLPLNHKPDDFILNGLITCVQHFAQFNIDDGSCIAGACEGTSLEAIRLAHDPRGNIRIAE